MAKAFPRKDVLFSLCTTLSSICKTYTNRPTTVDAVLKNFIVVTLTGTMKDQNAYQEASLRIDLFQKESSNGLEDVNGMETLYKSVISLFPIVTNKFSAISPKLVSGGSDEKGYQYLMIFANILTK